MHHCLCIAEIVAHICVQSDESLPWKRRLSTIVALAQTCRAFYEPATSHLWYDIDTLIPLVRCMPDDLWTFSDTPEEALIFKRAMLPTDWPRFKEHARRVRRFGCGFGVPDIDLSVSAYETLHVAAGGQVLLPHLKELFWDKTRADGAFPFISQFMAPDLRTFHLVSFRNLPTFSTLIGSLSTRYPFLSDVKILLPIEPNATSIVTTMVCGWDRLRHLSISSLSKEALIHVATLSELRCFSLEHQAHIEFPTAWSNTTFPALTHLLVTCHDFLFCINLVRSMAANTVLKSVTFDIRDAPSPGFGWQELTEALRDMHFSSSLRNITITDDDNDDEPYGEDLGEHLMIKADHIRPLLAFNHLSQLYLHTRYGFDFDDTLIGDMAKATPCLQQLTIYGGPDEGRIPRATIACLRELARHCKHLQSIKMAFNACLVNNLKTSQRVYATRLTWLDVIGSPISDSAQVAAFLSDIFPRLDSVVNCDSFFRDDPEISFSDMDQMWTEVESLVKEFAAMRAQEAACRKADDSDDEW